MNSEQMANTHHPDAPFMEKDDVSRLINCVKRGKEYRKRIAEIQAHRSYFAFSVVCFYIMLATVFGLIYFVPDVSPDVSNGEKNAIALIFSAMALFVVTSATFGMIRSAGLNATKYALLPGGLVFLLDKQIAKDIFKSSELLEKYRNNYKLNSDVFVDISESGLVHYSMVHEFTGTEREVVFSILENQFNEQTQELISKRKANFEAWKKEANSIKLG